MSQLSNHDSDQASNLNSCPVNMDKSTTLAGVPYAVSRNGMSRPAFNATVTPGTASPHIRRRNRMITSCLECRRRKLRCDKSHPCTNCIKFHRDCMFLAPALDTASQLKLTEIKEKMGSLERVLEHDVAKLGTGDLHGGLTKALAHNEVTDIPSEPDDEKDLEPTPLSVIDAAYDDDADGDLMDLGVQMGKMRFTDRIGGFVRPRMVEEMTSALSKDRDADSSPESKFETAPIPIPHYRPSMSFMGPGSEYMAPSSQFFFTNSNSATSLIDFLPARAVADRLLQQYWISVHPIACILHKPSFLKRYELFWAEVAMGIEPAGSVQAIVFSTMFSAVVSMPQDALLHYFGVGKKEMIANFQTGTETALGRANFIRTSKVETLQAFVMYLIPLCRSEVSRAHSAICGTAIRIAECMGLHRDPSTYGLGAVETHVRRLIWHHLCFLDLRTCESQGPRLGIRHDDFDTEYPLNVDEDDLEQHPPPTHSVDRWTDMTMTLIRFECHHLQRVVRADNLRLEKKKISLTAVLGKIENFRRTVGRKYLAMIDENVPVQNCGRKILEMLISKAQIMVLHRYQSGAASSSIIPDRIQNMTVHSGLTQLEASIELETNPVFSPWAWYRGALQQYHTALLLLVIIPTNCNQGEADRIWRCLDFVFECYIDIPRDRKYCLILSELRDKMGAYRDARKIRAPTGMHQVQMRSRKTEGSRTSSLISSSEYPSPNEGLHEQFDSSSATGEGLFVKVPGFQFQDNGSDTSSSQGGAPMPGAHVDDLMADIDWGEWDTLFPPNRSPF